MRILQVLSLTLLLAAAATAGPVVGTPTSANCYPFSCGPSDAVTQYLEVYSSAAFSGPLAINSVSFFRYLDEGSLAMDSATYDISFAVTPVGSSLIPGLENNSYSNLAAFGSFTLGDQMSDILTLTGTSSYAYDPSAGDLMMVVNIRDVTNAWGEYSSFFQADTSEEPLIRRAWTSTQNGAGETNATSALVTEFNIASSDTPEPASLGLAGLGLIGVWIARRRRA
jgi:hypothetical protein